MDNFEKRLHQIKTPEDGICSDPLIERVMLDLVNHGKTVLLEQNLIDLSDPNRTGISNIFPTLVTKTNDQYNAYDILKYVHVNNIRYSYNENVVFDVANDLNSKDGGDSQKRVSLSVFPETLQNAKNRIFKIDFLESLNEHLSEFQLELLDINSLSEKDIEIINKRTEVLKTRFGIKFALEDFNPTRSNFRKLNQLDNMDRVGISTKYLNEALMRIYDLPQKPTTPLGEVDEVLELLKEMNPEVEFYVKGNLLSGNFTQLRESGKIDYTLKTLNSQGTEVKDYELSGEKRNLKSV